MHSLFDFFVHIIADHCLLDSNSRVDSFDIMIFLANRLPLNMELFLRGKAEMADLLLLENERKPQNNEHDEDYDEGEVGGDEGRERRIVDQHE